MNDLFSRSGVKIDLDDAAAIRSGAKVVVSEEMVAGLREAFGEDFAPRIKAGHVCDLAIHQSQCPNEQDVIETFTVAGLSFPSTTTSRRQSGSVSVIETLSATPSIFVTPEFLLHLRPVENAGYQWQLVR